MCFQGLDESLLFKFFIFEIIITFISSFPFFSPNPLIYPFLLSFKFMDFKNVFIFIFYKVILLSIFVLF